MTFMSQDYGPAAALAMLAPAGCDERQNFRLISQEAGTRSRLCGIGAPYRPKKNK
jgi:hypothetical protein